MVQVQIHLNYNFDLRVPEMVPSTYVGSLILRTSHGEQQELFAFKGNGGIEEARKAAEDWVSANMLEYDNPSCRPLRYHIAGER